MELLSSCFYNQPLDYDGSQLCSHFALEQFGIYGDSLVAFAGRCDVQIEDLVDIEDVINNEPISSNRMLHFILEVFRADIERSVLFQRLLVSEIYKALVLNAGNEIRLEGDDIYCFDRKMSVSIATVSPVSCLCHTGVNITVKGAPIEVSALEELSIDPVKFAEFVLQGFKKEYIGIRKAISKVHPVK